MNKTVLPRGSACWHESFCCYAFLVVRKKAKPPKINPASPAPKPSHAGQEVPASFFSEV